MARKAPSAPAKTRKPATAAKSSKAQSSSKKATLKRPSAAAAFSDSSTWRAHAEALAASLHLSTDALLQRAVEAFAVAHGHGAAESLASAPAPQPPVTPAAASKPAPEKPAPAPAAAEAGDPPPLAPDVRLYVHGNGRPPQEMIRDQYVIGSSNRCDLWVNMPKVETRHLRIVREGIRYFAEDLGTEAGTVYDGRRLEGRHELKHEDSLFLAGYHRVRFYLLS